MSLLLWFGVVLRLQKLKTDNHPESSAKCDNVYLKYHLCSNRGKWGEWLLPGNHRSAIIVLMLQVSGSGLDSQVVVNICISTLLRLFTQDHKPILLLYLHILYAAIIISMQTLLLISTYNSSYVRVNQ